jgi:hypothetical protein
VKYSLALDNGFTGAIVLLNEDFKIVQWADMPTIPLTKKGKGGKIKHQHEISPTSIKDIIISMLKNIDKSNVKVYLETAGARPGQGLSSTFKIGRNFGINEGIIVGLELSYEVVHPRTWAGFMLKDVPAGDPKQRTMIKAQRLFGSSLPLMKPSGKILSMDGRADAALIAYYGMCQMLGTLPKTIIKTPVPKRG